MKKKHYIKFTNLLSYPTKMVWVEEYTYQVWYTYVNCKPVYNPHTIFVPGKWVKRKDYSAPFQEKGKYFVSHKYRYYRRMHTMAEKRASFEYPEHVRAKRNAENLPNSWNDVHIYIDKSWKSTHKCRKQWMKNL